MANMKWPYKVTWNGGEKWFPSFIQTARFINILAQNNKSYTLFFNDKDVTKEWVS